MPTVKLRTLPTSDEEKKDVDDGRIFDTRVKDVSEVEFASSRFSVPTGSWREKYDNYEVLHVVPPDATPEFKKLREGLPSIEVASMGELGRKCFGEVERLNTIQSVVHEMATTTDENLLVSAPTGAGKTNIAMLTILKVIRDHMAYTDEVIKDAFKIVYIAPMRALTSEITAKFQARLQRNLKLTVRKVTGEDNPSMKEIEDSQVLVVTPEKWDVLTRRHDAHIFTNRLKLMIIDEVHMLQTNRGPTLEAIVARTHIEHTEEKGNKLRIVGLSATLPNYRDVADFLRVNQEKGLFYFDHRFRAVPLSQTFIGINLSRVPRRQDEREMMDRLCYEQCMQFMERGQQVIVFTHSRKGTMELCQTFFNLASAENRTGLFKPEESVSESHEYRVAVKEMEKVENRDLRLHLPRGLGFHHAGIVKRDRQLVERQFTKGHVRVLMSTATLAWGVNLPAHAVIIRGTEVYDHHSGEFNELDVLDVQQIFGRAGRPQFDSSGEGVIITSLAKVHRYVESLVMQIPIESQLPSKLRNLLNAEVARGTIQSITNALEWMKLTYFYVRIRKNPVAYGISRQQLEEDPKLFNYRTRLCIDAAKDLGSAQMILFDAVNNDMPLSAMDLGRIAYRYYISFETMGALTAREGAIRLDDKLTDEGVLALISSADEFENIQPREVEMEELDYLAETYAVMKIRGGGIATREGKVNCLLQTYISYGRIEDSALNTELYIVSESAPRIARALFEIVLLRKRARAAMSALRMSKAIHLRHWPFNSPLRALINPGVLKLAVVETIERMSTRTNSEKMLERMLTMNEDRLGREFGCDGGVLHNALRMLPRLDVNLKATYVVDGIWSLDVRLTPNFIWFDRLAGTGEQSTQHFWIFLEDVTADVIVCQEQHRVPKWRVIDSRPVSTGMSFAVHPGEEDHKYQLRVTSDRYMTPDSIVEVVTSRPKEVWSKPTIHAQPDHARRGVAAKLSRAGKEALEEGNFDELGTVAVAGKNLSTELQGANKEKEDLLAKIKEKRGN